MIMRCRDSCFLPLNQVIGQIMKGIIITSVTWKLHNVTLLLPPHLLMPMITLKLHDTIILPLLNLLIPTLTIATWMMLFFFLILWHVLLPFFQRRIIKTHSMILLDIMVFFPTLSIPAPPKHHRKAWIPWHLTIGILPILIPKHHIFYSPSSISTTHNNDQFADSTEYTGLLSDIVKMRPRVPTMSSSTTNLSSLPPRPPSSHNSLNIKNNKIRNYWSLKEHRYVYNTNIIYATHLSFDYRLYEVINYTYILL